MMTVNEVSKLTGVRPNRARVLKFFKKGIDSDAA